MSPLLFTILMLATLGYAFVCFAYGLVVLGFKIGDFLVSRIPQRAKSPSASNRNPSRNARH